MALVQGVEGEDQRTVPGFMSSGAMTLMVASTERPPTRAVTRMLPVRLLVRTGTPPSTAKSEVEESLTDQSA